LAIKHHNLILRFVLYQVKIFISYEYVFTVPVRNMNKGTLAVPCVGQANLGAPVSPHFGRCDSYAIVKLEGGKIKDVASLSNTAHTECAGSVRMLVENGVSLILVTAMGMRPYSACRQLGIEVRCGIAGTVADAIESYLTDKTLPITEDSLCQSHLNE
jgi:predicted Fe-Mo cluster-binding NifX family protein